MADRFFPDFEFDPDRSFMHIRDGIARFDEVRANLIVVEGDAQEANDTLDDWAGDVNRTVIAGGKIETGSVTAAQLSALSIEVGKYIASSNYVAGSDGWRIDGDGNAEFNDVTVRGSLTNDVATIDDTTATFSSGTTSVRMHGGTVDLYSGSDWMARFSATGAGSFLMSGNDGGPVELLGVYLRAADGSQGLPGITFDSDPDTGFYHVGADYMAASLGGANHFEFTVDGFRPPSGKDGALKLGGSSRRWSEVYATNGTINTSDGGEKTDVSGDTLGLDFVRAVKPVTFRWNDGTRPHTGFVAEQVRDVLDSIGSDWAGFIDPSFSGDDGPLGLRYHEFVAPLVAAVQQLAEQVDALTAQVDSHNHR